MFANVVPADVDTLLISAIPVATLYLVFAAAIPVAIVAEILAPAVAPNLVALVHVIVSGQQCRKRLLAPQSQFVW